ncbi:hypothetical protein C0J52_10818 [Blattella germanica]|nr:hypothetical protein C0J52_10818 [Blattella germanica]
MGTREPPQPGGLTTAPPSSCLRKKSSSSLENQDITVTNRAPPAMRMSLLGHEETPEDSEPLIETSAATKLTTSGGESNVHFVPEGPEDEDAGHVGEEKSLMHRHDLEDRPRLPTPPPSLTKVVSFGDVTNTPPPSSYPSVEEEAILPPPKQFHPKHRHTSSISITSQAYPKGSYVLQQYQPPASALRRRSSVKSASGGNSSSANLQVAGPGPDQRRRTSVPVMPSSSGHGNLQQIASYPADTTAIRNVNNSYPSERFYAARGDSTSSDVGRREKVRLQRQGTGDVSVSSDVLNVGTRGSAGVGSGSAVGGGKGSPPPYLLNGGGTDLLTTGGNASSPNVASIVKTSPGDQGPDMTFGVQRSVSEKSRERSALSHYHHHRPQYQQSAQPPPPAAYQTDRKLPHHIPQLKRQKSLLHSHVQSTPNVASTQRTSTAMRHHHQASVTNVPAMCSAVSEGELLDLAILPIFQKLLSERHKSRTGYGASIASCPNISIKCDIVEYL